MEEFDQEQQRDRENSEEPELGTGDKKSPKKGILLGFAVFLILTTFGIGPLGINFYKSEVRKEEVAYNQNMNAFDFDAHSFKINYYFEDQYVNAHIFGVAIETPNADFSEVELEVHEEVTAYEGNYFTPFYKDYAVKYNAVMKDEGVGVESAASGLFSAKVEGTLKIKVFGFCTIGKAKAIARKEIEKSVANYINNQMSQAMSR